MLIYIAGQLDAMFYIHSSQLMITLGLKVKTALIGVIYRKVSLINENNIYCGRTLFSGYTILSSLAFSVSLTISLVYKNKTKASFK
jgi:hypothetical protein